MILNILLSGLLALLLLGFSGCMIYNVIYPNCEDCAEEEAKANKKMNIALIVNIFVFVGFIFAGIGISDNDDRKFVAEYQAQKYTIESSLNNAELTGLERIELLKLATDLNKQLTSRKYDFNKWYNVHYDNSIYDNIEFINLGGTQE